MTCVWCLSGLKAECGEEKYLLMLTRGTRDSALQPPLMVGGRQSRCPNAKGAKLKSLLGASQGPQTMDSSGMPNVSPGRC